MSAGVSGQYGNSQATRYGVAQYELGIGRGRLRRRLDEDDPEGPDVVEVGIERLAAGQVTHTLCKGRGEHTVL